MKQGILAVVLLLVMACNDKPVEKTTGGSNDTTTVVGSDDNTIAITSDIPDGIKQCYSVLNRDTVLLSFTRRDTAVSGELTYKFFEKDRNTGIINGRLRGDTIIADYKFTAEGTTSVRQVVFLKQGDVLVEGFGDVEDDNGRMIFRDISTLVFDSSILFTRTDCNKLPIIK
ncbi:hypothetical protein ACX0G7_20195 [Flavitalea antarctica]